MLFDLRSPGRRRLIQVIFVTMAILLGGSLVLFGVGSDVQGGLIDAITGSGGNDSSAASSQLKDREKKLLKAARTNPDNPQTWIQLGGVRYRLAGEGDNFDQEQSRFTREGREQLKGVVEAWNRYIALKPKNLDPGFANTVMQALGPAGLNYSEKAYFTQQRITQADPSYENFANLAYAAYQADRTRVGDLASLVAVRKAPESMKAELKESLGTAQALRQLQVQQEFQQQQQPAKVPFSGSSPFSGGPLVDPAAGP